MADILTLLKRRLSSAQVKVETVIQMCINLDSNRDKIIHMDDLKSIFRYLLGDACPSRRELHALEGLLKVDSRGDISYERLEELLSADYHPVNPVNFEDDTKANFQLEVGSLGEWLQRAACPLEVQSYKRLIYALESFEKETGLRINTTREGLIVPLGPDLRAAVKFFIE